jgi:signal transduction histidine kinase
MMSVMFERIERPDVAITALMTALGVLLMAANVFGDDFKHDPEQEAVVAIYGVLPRGFAFALFTLVTLPLLWRRAAPVAAAAASLAGLFVNYALLGSGFIRCGVVLPTAYLLAFAGGRHLEGRPARFLLALVVGLAAGDLALTFGWAEALVLGVVAPAVTWGIARVVRSRAAMVDELELRTAELRAARDERARLEVATDRARLSRELDELLHQRLAALAAAAGEGAALADGPAAASVLAEIERESRATLEQMRALVGGLREGDEAPTAPQPTLTHLEALILRAKQGARLTVEGSPRVLPAAVELSAYRIVEQLLDALADAPGVTVGVAFSDDALELRVAGPVRRGARASFDRARERALSQRGSLDAVVRAGRAEATVALPLGLAV